MDTNQKGNGSIIFFLLFVAVVGGTIGYFALSQRSASPKIDMTTRHCPSPSDANWAVEQTMESDSCYWARMQEQEYQQNKLNMPVADTSADPCCMHCTTGQACGNSCISINLECHQPAGCACSN